MKKYKGILNRSRKAALTALALVTLGAQSGWSADSPFYSGKFEELAPASSLVDRLGNSILEIFDPLSPCEVPVALLLENEIGIKAEDKYLQSIKKSMQREDSSESKKLEESILSQKKIIGVTQDTGGKNYLRVRFGTSFGVNKEKLSSNPALLRQYQQVFIKFPSLIHRQLFQCFMLNNHSFDIAPLKSETFDLFNEVISFNDFQVVKNGVSLSRIELNTELARFLPLLRTARSQRRDLDKQMSNSQFESISYSNLDELNIGVRWKMPFLMTAIFGDSSLESYSHFSESQKYQLALWYEYINRK
jgi:hypothetical protein